MTDPRPSNSPASSKHSSEPETGPLNPLHGTEHPGPRGGAYDSRGPVDSVGDPVTPGEAQVAETRSDDSSAGEAGAPADMDYYRTSQKTGNWLALGTLAVPLVLILLVIVAAVWFYA
ncbi:MAG: hypothetical protein FJX25_04600 [Alphaproteobacteria bacterium]|nr:hypothetical protein [Alphaproteobacteria bacterium]